MPTLTPPTFCRPLDGFVTTLAAAHALGSGVLALTDASPLGAPSLAAPVRLTVLSADGAATVGAQCRFTVKPRFIIPPETT